MLQAYCHGHMVGTQQLPGRARTVTGTRPLYNSLSGVFPGLSPLFPVHSPDSFQHVLFIIFEVIFLQEYGIAFSPEHIFPG